MEKEEEKKDIRKMARNRKQGLKNYHTFQLLNRSSSSSVVARSLRKIGLLLTPEGEASTFANDDDDDEDTEATVVACCAASVNEEKLLLAPSSSLLPSS